MKKLTLFTVLIFITSFASAETITLISGKVVEGQVVEKTDEFIKVDSGVGVTTTYYLDEIQGYSPSHREINSKNADDYLRLGSNDAQLGKYDSAIENFEIALGIEPDNAAVNANLGAVYVVLERFDKAFLYLEKAIKVQPNNLSSFGVLENVTYANYVNVATSLGYMDKAEEAANTAININPKYSEGLMMLATHYGTQGRKDDMIETLEKAINLNPEFVTGYILLTATYIAKGVENKERVNFKKARENALKAKGLLEKMGGFEVELQSINKRLIELDDYEAKLDN